MDCKLLHDILSASLKMRVSQKLDDNFDVDFKKQPTLWQPWRDSGTIQFHS